LEGGLGPSLLYPEKFKHGNSDEKIARVISRGIPEMGMIPFKNQLDDKQIRSLVIYIREIQSLESKKSEFQSKNSEEGIIKSKLHDFKVDLFAEKPGVFWGISFINSYHFLVTEISGELFLFENGEFQKIKGLPRVFNKGQGGLLDVLIDPDYESNGWIYISYAGFSSQDKKNLLAGMTVITRGKIRNNQWVESEILYEAPIGSFSTKGVHFGSRLAIQGDYLYFTIGDRGSMMDAQNINKPNGKVHRIFTDGRIPKDNPFADSQTPTIWSYGHRNPQGLAIDPRTGKLWESEHGPRGGDEINLIKRGLNYGWPVITYGMNYDGSSLTDLTEKEGMEQPAHYWTPSIAACGMDFYNGELFPAWKNDLFIGGLAMHELHRLKIEGNKVVEDEVIVSGLGRIRDVCSGPDGAIWLLINKRDSGNTTAIVRLIPSEREF
jgi:glucose/arabinose dehydrogenase